MKRRSESTTGLSIPLIEPPASTRLTQPYDWVSLKIPGNDFDLSALHAALKTKKCQLSLTWADVVSEISSPFQNCRPRLIRASNLRDLNDTRFGVEAGIVLLVLSWLGRSPESFVPGHPGADRPEAKLPSPGAGALPNFDLIAIKAQLDAERKRRDLLWLEIAREIGGPFTANGLRRLHHARFVRFPAVMRLARWLRCPAGSLLVRSSPWANAM